jgi:hypothetical protein
LFKSLANCGLLAGGRDRRLWSSLQAASSRWKHHAVNGKARRRLPVAQQGLIVDTSDLPVSALARGGEPGAQQISKLEQRYDAVIAVIQDGLSVTEVAERIGTATSAGTAAGPGTMGGPQGLVACKMRAERHTWFHPVFAAIH